MQDDAHTRLRSQLQQSTAPAPAGAVPLTVPMSTVGLETMPPLLPQELQSFFPKTEPPPKPTSNGPPINHLTESQAQSIDELPPRDGRRPLPQATKIQNNLCELDPPDPAATAATADSVISTSNPSSSESGIGSSSSVMSSTPPAPSSAQPHGRYLMNHLSSLPSHHVLKLLSHIGTAYGETLESIVTMSLIRDSDGRPDHILCVSTPDTRRFVAPVRAEHAQGRLQRHTSQFAASTADATNAMANATNSNSNTTPSAATRSQAQNANQSRAKSTPANAASAAGSNNAAQVNNDRSQSQPIRV